MKNRVLLCSAERGFIIKSNKLALEEKYKNQIAAIELISGEIFIGANEMEVLEKASKKYPNKAFYFIKIGGTFKRQRPV